MAPALTWTSGMVVTIASITADRKRQNVRATWSTASSVNVSTDFDRIGCSERKCRRSNATASVTP